MKQGLISNLLVFFSAQSGLTVLGVIRTILLPLLLSLAGFGQWQTFVLYVSFLGLFSLGFNDGLVLKYIGIPYDKWLVENIRSAIVVFTVINLFLTILGILIVLLIINEENRLLANILVLNIPIVGTTGLFLTLLQAKNEMRKYSLFLAFDKVLLTLLVLAFWWFEYSNVLVLIYADMCFRLASIIILLVQWRSLLFGKILNFKDAYFEYVTLVTSGVKLLLANLLSMLLFGAGRFIIQLTYPIDLFAIYSFGLVLVNFIMIAITSTSTVVYPHLANISDEEKLNSYFKINQFILIFAPLVFIFYYPVAFFVKSFYIEYIDILDYFIIFLAFVVVTARMSVLNNTFFKLLRLENEMLKVNFFSLVFFGLIYIVAMIVFGQSLFLIAITTLTALLFRVYYSQSIIVKNLHISFSWIEMIWELLIIYGIVLLFFSNYQSVAIGVVLVISLISFIVSKKFNIL